MPKRKPDAMERLDVVAGDMLACRCGPWSEHGRKLKRAYRRALRTLLRELADAVVQEGHRQHAMSCAGDMPTGMDVALRAAVLRRKP